MRASLRLEWIGANYSAYAKYGNGHNDIYEHQILMHGMARAGLKPWVARLTGLDNHYGFAREFIRGVKDYSEANSVGSRGVYEYFTLKPGIYEVNRRTSWKRAERYFINVANDASITIVNREEVVRCLRSDI